MQQHKNKNKNVWLWQTLKNEKARHVLSFPGVTLGQLLQYIDVNLKIQHPSTTLIHATGINEVLNERRQSNIENLSNMKYVVQ